MRRIYRSLSQTVLKGYNMTIELEGCFSLSKSDKKLLKKNIEYMQCNKGERCFILGNGPSLKSVDLSLLCEEKVFTVNQINRHTDFKFLNPTYHFWSDPSFFSLDLKKEEDIELLSVMKSIGENNNVHCFFPIEQRSFCEKNDINKIMNVSYFSSKTRFYDNYKKNIDFTKIVPNFGTVVQLCITMAIYMGFKEIYLLGCDNTGIMVTIKSMLNSNDQLDYVYSISENEKRRMENLLNKHTLEDYTKSYLNTICDYRRLFDYCAKRNVRLINCSENTVIDSIPRKNLRDVLGVK